MTGLPPRPLNLLVVDDEQQILELLELTLGLRGYAVWTALDGPQALEVCRQRPIDVIVMDVMMSPWDGFETVRRLHDQYRRPAQPAEAGAAAPMPPVVFLSGLNPPEALPELAGQLVQTYLVKPFRPTELILAIERVWAAQHGHPEN
ncbi:response regulator [Deinococcus radiopugnans]|uniref:CheY-like chemotaxis protein n=1 Tax=Deinococcus radiopugnans ATCC 19172 TaxID=585398 RepID=A0ABR6NW53_9DEIO|nr:response regulator [Deinococcus radiopugnans]MBB6017679.1 CheY-like chemotaxis protein [Deinococcus radiopugnans ATCC 19172]